jgi:hypothetical protein
VASTVLGWTSPSSPLSQLAAILKEYLPASDVDYRHCFELIDEFGLGDAFRTVGELERDELLELNARWNASGITKSWLLLS